jgi:hypothetical protein
MDLPTDEEDRDETRVMLVLTGDWGTSGQRWTPEDWDLAPSRFGEGWIPQFRPNPYKGEIEGDE